MTLHISFSRLLGICSERIRVSFRFFNLVAFLTLMKELFSESALYVKLQQFLVVETQLAGLVS